MAAHLTVVGHADGVACRAIIERHLVLTTPSDAQCAMAGSRVAALWVALPAVARVTVDVVTRAVILHAQRDDASAQSGRGSPGREVVSNRMTGAAPADVFSGRSSSTARLRLAWMYDWRPRRPRRRHRSIAAHTDHRRELARPASTPASGCRSGVTGPPPRCARLHSNMVDRWRMEITDLRDAPGEDCCDAEARREHGR